MSNLQVRIKFGGESQTVRDIDFAQCDALIKSKVGLMLDEYGPKIADKARRNLRERTIHPEKSTGKAARSIFWRRVPNGVRIYMGVSYGGFVEEDTKPHDIYPRRARALHWISIEASGGSWENLAGLTNWRNLLAGIVSADRYAAHVHHPGTKGKHMIRDAVRDYEPVMTRRVTEILRQSLLESARY
jgi:hypothetical protein